MTIEERAKAIINKKYGGWDFDLKRWATECCVETATEQDIIARQEECDRCIRAIERWRCKQCRYCPYYDKTTCPQLKDIRKALEGG